MVYSSNIISITSSTTLSTAFDVYIVSASGGSITITLPTISADGMQYKIKRTDNTPANTVTIQGTGGQTIDGITTFSMDALTCCEIQALSSAWYVTSNSQLVPGLNTYYNAYRNTASAITITNTANGVNIPFPTLRVSNAESGSWTTGAGGTSFTVPVTGIYEIIHAIHVNNTGGGTQTCSSCLTVNSTTPSTSGIAPGFGSTITYPTAHTNVITASGIISLTAGNILRVYARSLSATANTILAATSLYTLDNTQTTILIKKLA
jgi:hypothetical protein